MSGEPRAIDLPSFAFEVAERSDPNAWLALICPADALTGVAVRFADCLRELSGEPVQVAAARSAGEVVTVVRKRPDEITVFVIADDFAWAQWKTLDLERSKLQHRHPVVLLLSPEAAVRMARSTPNLMSWIAAIWQLQKAVPLSDAERSQRLAALGERFGMTNEEVVRRGELKELTANPDLAEWLLLLGRGDLIEP